MIASLSIENFALIDKLSIDFSDGFSIITGETGAGKSILLGALGLVLGKRADLTSLKSKSEKCIIEAQFRISQYNLQSFFEANDLDYDDETILRREILPSGKSRAFVNDSPVNLQKLQELGVYLIDIHSQHQTQELSDDDFQFRILDAIAGNTEAVNQYSEQLRQHKKSQAHLTSLKQQLHDAMKEQDYHAFLLDELLAAGLRPGEQEELESAYEQLNNVELIKENLEKSLALANEEQFGVLQNIREIKNALSKIAQFSNDYNELSERAESAAIEFADLMDEVGRHFDSLIQDPMRLEQINEKLQLIYNLQKKHQVSTIDELLQIQENLDTKVMSKDSLESEIQALENQLLQSSQNLDKLAAGINEKREASIPILTQQLTQILIQLGMPNVRFQINVEQGNSYLHNGKDTLEFLFAANKGSDFGLLKKVASGGELSRIMLAVKAILAKYSKLPTIIFDEIDTGVSGEIADKMGEIMKSMSNQMQVLAITHLPQIAAKGLAHYKVYKTIADNQTYTKLDRLSNDQRITEIAQMLSGKDISDSAINHAKALLN